MASSDVGSSIVAHVARDVVAVWGPDATTFLQSLLSQDLDPVAVGGSAHALLLEPRGKLVVDMRVAHVTADEWWCVCEPGFGAVLAAGLKRFRIRVKVDIEDRSTAVAAAALRGPDAIELHAGVLEPAGSISVRVDWGAAPGIEIVGEPTAIDAVIAELASAGAREITDDAYDTMRIEAGVPRQGFDIDETTIAQEAFLERDAVSFTKGCFLGQELVCRIDTRGHVNRLLRRLHADAPIARGATLLAGGKEVGTVTSAAGTVGLAMVRRQVEPGTAVTAGNVTATVEAVYADESA
jgi:tRNA-modifying protein YgfZ